MNFLAALLVYAQDHNISHEEMSMRHQNYCQNLYWQPDASDKLKAASCDITIT
jgi:hypothetical protein